MRILHTADLHLRRMGDERWRALEKLVDVARREKVELFLISGDLFNRDVDAEILETGMRRVFSKVPFKVVLIPGNHDREAYREGLYLGEEVEVIDRLDRPFEHGDVVVWGMPFEDVGPGDVLDRLRSLSDILPRDRTNILLYHGELRDALFSKKDFGEEEGYMPVSLLYFEGLNIDYVLAGHFHTSFRVWTWERDRYFVYPGSPVSITRKERGRRKVNIFETGNPPGEYPVDTFHFEHLQIELDPSMENPALLIENRIGKLHPEARLILKVKGYIDRNRIGMDVSQLKRMIEEKLMERMEDRDFKFEVKDVTHILEDDLFRTFLGKLEDRGYEEDELREIRELVIRAMVEAGV